MVTTPSGSSPVSPRTLKHLRDRWRLFAPALLLLATLASPAEAVYTFEDLELVEGSYWNGADANDGFHCGSAFFGNRYNADWGVWDGFAYSNRTDANAVGIEGQYTAVTGSGQGRSDTYGVAFVGWKAPPILTFETPQQVGGLYVTNNAYARYDMLNGSQFSKKFGGETGNEEDWFKLLITGLDATGEATGTVEFYLADFRHDDNAMDYIVDSWTFIDLRSLGVVESLEFQLASSDEGLFGMNTPAYFCLDTIVPGPAVTTFDEMDLPPEAFWNGADGAGGFQSGGAYLDNRYNADWNAWDGFAYSNRTDANTVGLKGQYTAVAGTGQGGSSGYGIGFVGWEMPPTLTLDTPQQLGGLFVTNNRYAYEDMLNGSQFSKRFGGETGDDEDWFRLTVTGFDPAGQTTGSVEFYLADFRPADNALDYILDTWAFVDLTSLGLVETLVFQLDSSDQGPFGMNTPAYFCLDSIVPAVGANEVPEPEPPAGDDATETEDTADDENDAPAPSGDQD